MAPQVAAATRASRRSAPRPPAPPVAPRPWWGDGAAPLELWPGVTISFDVAWNAQLARWETHAGKYYFDEQAADRACAFPATFLRHHIGEFNGQPFELMEYQKKLLTRVIFGWKKASDGIRRFRKVFAFLPKGAGKSPWGAQTGLMCMVADDEPAAEIYAVAGDKNQARVVHDNARIMVDDSPDLSEVCDILRDSILYRPSRSFYQVLSADASTKHGFRPHVVIFDELHGQKNRSLFEALWRSMIKRRQPLMIIITHAGEDDEGICYEEYEYAKGVLEGKIDDESMLPVIFELGPKDDFTDPANWRKVNPGHGITVKHDQIVTMCAEAVANPRKLNEFLRWHGNRWTNQAEAWIPVAWWDTCTGEIPPDDVLARLQGAVGIDMSQKYDLTAAVAVFRVPLPASEDVIEIDLLEEAIDVAPDGQADVAIVKRSYSLNYQIAIVPAFWLPEATLLERVKQDKLRYDLWAKEIWRGQPLLRVTGGHIIDGGAVVDYIAGRQRGAHAAEDVRGADLVTRYPVLKQQWFIAKDKPGRGRFGYDPAFAREVAVGLEQRGLTTIEVPQNHTHLSEACQVFEALVKAGRVLHGSNRLLRQHVENVMVKPDAGGRIKPVKPRKQTKRIDGLVATLIALSQLIRMPFKAPKAASRGARVWTPEGFKDA